MLNPVLSEPKARARSIRYRCRSCTKLHQGLPELTFGAPDRYVLVPESERADRARLGTDYCVVDDCYFYLRCRLELPVRGFAETLRLGVWARIGKDLFTTYFQRAGSVDELAIEPFFCLIANDLPGYPGTNGLPGKVVAGEGRGGAPSLVPGAAEHPLARDARDGLSIERALEIVHASRLGALIVLG